MGTNRVVGVQNWCQRPMVLVCGNQLEEVGWIFQKNFSMMWVMVLL